MTAPHVRRPRYPGRNPRRFQDKYKELNPERYASEVQKVVASGRTPAGMHRPIMVDEVLRALAPAPGDIAVDCTLGGGGHAQAILQRVLPGGRLIGLDVDPFEQPRTEARLRAAGFGPDVFVTHRRNFAGLPQVLAAEGVAAADVILADLGVSSMQLDNPERGFTFKGAGPLDMRMNPSRGEPASKLLTHLSDEKLRALLAENADEPHAEIIASLLKQRAARNHRGAGARGAQRSDCRDATHHGGGRGDVDPTHLPGAAHCRERRVRRPRRAAAVAAAVPGAWWSRGVPDVPLRRGPPREEGVPGRRARWRLRFGERRSRACDGGGTARQSARLVREAALGRARRRALVADVDARQRCGGQPRSRSSLTRTTRSARWIFPSAAPPRRRPSSIARSPCCTT